MSSTTHFITELVRAANELEKLSAYEKRRLLERAVITIREMRETVGIPSRNTSADAVTYIQETEVLLVRGWATDERVKASLLDAADMIRTLHIILDSGR